MCGRFFVTIHGCDPKGKLALFMVDPSAVGHLPFQGRLSCEAVVPPLKGEGDRKAVEGSSVNGTDSPFT